MTNKLLKLVVEELDKRLAKDIKILDFNNVSPLNDYFVITEADNSRHALALVDHLKDVLAKNKYPLKFVEGNETSDWILVDMDSILVHIFVNKARDVYQLERLWGDLRVLTINDL